MEAAKSLVKLRLWVVLYNCTNLSLSLPSPLKSSWLEWRRPSDFIKDLKYIVSNLVGVASSGFVLLSPPVTGHCYCLEAAKAGLILVSL
jgi:hypothetical protein